MRTLLLQRVVKLGRGLADLPAADFLQPSPLRRIEHHVRPDGDGDREHDEREPDLPRKDEKQNKAEDDPGDAPLHMRCHADSVSLTSRARDPQTGPAPSSLYAAAHRVDLARSGSWRRSTLRAYVIVIRVHDTLGRDAVTIWMPVEPAANELLTRSPLALLIAMLLDQQVPLERAFSAPLDLVRRLGHEPTTAELAEFDPDALAFIFSERPALHRYPRAMAARVQDLARLIMEQYDGEPERVWTSATPGAELL